MNVTKPLSLRHSLLCLVVILSCCEAYRILVVFPMPGKSHSILGNAYVRHLLNDGHEVSYVTPFPYKDAPSNLSVIDVSSNIGIFPETLNITRIMTGDLNLHLDVLPLMMSIARNTIENENVQKLFHDPNEKFDLVIAEWMMGNLLSGFAAVFNCPLIWSSSVDAHVGVLILVDQPPNPSFTPGPLCKHSPPFGFFQRAVELVTLVGFLLLRYTYLETVESSCYNSLMAPAILKQGRVPPPYSDVEFNASLVMTNSHVSLGQTLPIPQSVISIGGYHVEESIKPLSDGLKEIMDNAKNGVIYFSMGSNLRSFDIPKQLKEDLLNMFGELKQTVLWKFEEDLPNTPENVHILKWAPQLGILGHPNTILFITHGGFLSTIESIHFGVPIIGIPVFGDQFLNVAKAVNKGYAQKVDLSMTMTRNLKITIEEMIANPKYAQRVKELSLIYHDRPVPPGKELLHWVKHVIKTRGALHLRSPALHVPFYQKLYLDLLAVILIVLFIIVRIFKYLFKAFSSENKIDKTKKNK